MQVELVCLLCQCMVDAARWEGGLKACENAMSVLPSATHLPLSQWKVDSCFTEYISHVLCRIHVSRAVQDTYLTC